MSRRIVIDADVARAAGDKIHPTSSRCRKTLESVLKICHKIVLDDKSNAEWMKHKSLFASNWLGAMASRGKLVRFTGSRPVTLSNDISNITTANAIIHNIIQYHPNSEQQLDNFKKIALKDIHLVETAAAHDLVIISCDDNARDKFRLFSNCIPRIRKVAWVNPTKPDENALEWLNAGARPENSRKLGTR